MINRIDTGDLADIEYSRYVAKQLDQPTTLGDLFAAEDFAALERAKAEIAAEQNDPEHRARVLTRIAERDAKIDAEIAAGLRDADGEWIEDSDGLEPEIDDEDDDSTDNEEN